MTAHLNPSALPLSASTGMAVSPEVRATVARWLGRFATLYSGSPLAHVVQGDGDEARGLLAEYAEALARFTPLQIEHAAIDLRASSKHFPRVAEWVGACRETRAQDVLAARRSDDPPAPLPAPLARIRNEQDRAIRAALVGVRRVLAIREGDLKRETIAGALVMAHLSGRLRERAESPEATENDRLAWARWREERYPPDEVIQDHAEALAAAGQLAIEAGWSALGTVGRAMPEVRDVDDVPRTSVSREATLRRDAREEVGA